MLRTDRKTRIALTGAVLLVLSVAGGRYWKENYGLPKRFAVVESEKVFRSGVVTPAQLEYVTHEFGLRSVLSLLDPKAPESIAEKAAAERLGLRWINVPLPGNGASDAAQRARIRAVLLDPSLEPILLHCAAGTNRTGLAAGMYRLYVQHWPLDAVLDEMFTFGFENEPKHRNLLEALRSEAELADAETPP